MWVYRILVIGKGMYVYDFETNTQVYDCYQQKSTPTLCIGYGKNQMVTLFWSQLIKQEINKESKRIKNNIFLCLSFMYCKPLHQLGLLSVKLFFLSNLLTPEKFYFLYKNMLN